MSKRSKATDISNKVRKIVKDRDKYCVICGSSHNLEIAHYISRKHGGLGIPENLILLCKQCHYNYDFTTQRNNLKMIIESYLSRFESKELVYKKEIL